MHGGDHLYKRTERNRRLVLWPGVRQQTRRFVRTERELLLR